MAGKSVQQLNFNPLMEFMGNSIIGLGQLKAGLDQVKYAKYNQGLSDAEAKIEENKATYNSWIIQTRADIEETQHVEEGRRIEGRLRAEAGASGAALSSGSVLQNLANTHAELEKDRLLIRFNADLEDKSQRYASDARAAGLRNQAAAGVFASKIARNNSILQAGSTLLSANVKYNESLYSPKMPSSNAAPLDVGMGAIGTAPKMNEGPPIPTGRGSKSANWAVKPNVARPALKDKTRVIGPSDMKIKVS